MDDREDAVNAPSASPTPSPYESPRSIAAKVAPHGPIPTHVRYYVVGWLTTAAALAYLCRNSIGIAESQIRADLGITLTQSGYVMAAFFWSYAFLQVPTGAFSHKYGSRLALPIFAIGWGAMTLATGLAPGLWLLIAAQLLMGVAQAGIFPASTNTINYWMPMAQRSIGCGILSAGMQVGAIVSAILMGVLISVIGWRWSFVLISPLSVVWAIDFYRRFRNRPEQATEVNEAEQQLIVADRPRQQVLAAADDDGGPTDWIAVLRHPGLWLIHGQQICRSAGYMFFASWFPTFLQKTRDVSIEQSGYMQSVVLAGALLGGLAGGVLTDWLWRRTGNLWLSRSGVGTAALGCCAALILGSWFVTDLSAAIALLALGVFFAQLASPAMFAAVIDISGPRVAQLLGAVNMTGNLAVAVCPILVGLLFDQTENWNLVLVLFAGIYLIGAICWALVDPRFGIFDQEGAGDETSHTASGAPIVAADD